MDSEILLWVSGGWAMLDEKLLDEELELNLFTRERHGAVGISLYVHRVCPTVINAAIFTLHCDFDVNVRLSLSLSLSPPPPPPPPPRGPLAPSAPSSSLPLYLSKRPEASLYCFLSNPSTPYTGTELPIWKHIC
jgi:hypothetical protein